MQFFVDRGYVEVALVDDVLRRGGEIVCRPWVPKGKGVFTKAAFKINVRDLTITSPAGETKRIVWLGHRVRSRGIRSLHAASEAQQRPPRGRAHREHRR